MLECKEKPILYFPQKILSYHVLNSPFHDFSFLSLPFIYLFNNHQGTTQNANMSSFFSGVGSYKYSGKNLEIRLQRSLCGFISAIDDSDFQVLRGRNFQQNQTLKTVLDS